MPAGVTLLITVLAVLNSEALPYTSPNVTPRVAINHPIVKRGW